MDTIEELTAYENRIDRAHVERRIEDWQHRVAKLYDRLEGWLPPGWSAQRRLDVIMDEQVMRNVGLSGKRLPSLVLQHGTFAVRLEPRALEIMGANGRVDIVSPVRHAVIVDRADLYDAPQWTIAPFRDQLAQHPLTQASFVETLS